MQFAFDNFKKHNIVVVNGYFPSLSVKRLLKTIIEGGLGYDGSFRNVLDQVRCIMCTIVDVTSTDAREKLRCLLTY